MGDSAGSPVPSSLRRESEVGGAGKQRERECCGAGVRGEGQGRAVHERRLTRGSGARAAASGGTLDFS
jgi:hypothetical protein